MVAEEDKQGISPGSEKLTKLFETYGPALVLIDEWVAYSRQIYGKDGLPSEYLIAISHRSSSNGKRQRQPKGQL
jgi:hypothetical protein